MSGSSMQWRALLSAGLLLLLAISVSALSSGDSSLSSLDASLSSEAVSIRSASAMNPLEVENALRVAETWPSIRPFWTREALPSACASPGSVRGIISCSPTGFVTGLNFSRSPDYFDFPRLAEFRFLRELESFESSLPINSQLPADWDLLTKLNRVVILGTRILGGTVPQSWNALSNLRHFEIEFSPTNDVYNYPGSATPTWFTRLDTLIMSFVNFGTHASFETVIPRLQTLKLYNVGWNYLLPRSSGDRLQTLSITGPLDRAGRSRLPLPNRLVSFNDALNTIELLNVPTITSYPQISPFTTRIVLRNLQNMQGPIPSVWSPMAARSRVQHFEMSRCPLINGNIILPSAQSTLETLILRDVGFTGTIPRTLFQASSLQSLELAGLTQLSVSTMPSIPETATSCNLHTLVLATIRLQGTIPTSIARKCEKLEKLDLSNNHLDGNLPSAWASPYVKEFNVAFNGLHGYLPEGLNFVTAQNGAEHGVNIFDIRSNYLEGTVPPSYFMARFELFDVSNNRMDLCRNAGALLDAPKNSLRDGGCALVPQSSSVCPCVHTWPAHCIPARTC